MELPISILCPHCGVKLKIQNAALLGRRLKCPKCGKSFTPEVPAEPKDETYGIAEETAPPPPLPAPPLKSRAKPKTADSDSIATSSDSEKQSKKSAKTKSSRNTALLIASGGAGGLLLIAFVVWMMMGRGRTIIPERGAHARTSKQKAKRGRKEVGKEVAVAKVLTAPQDPQSAREIAAEKADALNRQGLALLARGEAAEAEPYFHQAMEKFGLMKMFLVSGYPRHPIFAESLNNLGTALQARGELAAAERNFRDALEIEQKLFPADKYPDGDRLLANSLKSLGNLYEARGDPAEAEQFYRQSLEMRQKLFPAAKFPQGNPDLAEGLTLLGGVLRTRGELAKAEPYCRQALEMNQKLYPADRFPEGNHGLAQSLNNLGSVLQARGALDKAEPYCRQALEMWRRLYPADKFPQGHYGLAQSLNNVGSVLQSRDELDKAEPYFRQALDMYQRLFPADKYRQGHPDLAMSLNNLGFVLRARGDLAAAEPYFRQALAMNQKLYPRDKFPDGHPSVARSLHNLGDLLYARGDLDSAEPFLLQAVKMYLGCLEVLAELSSETEALNFAASLPNTRDIYLTVTARLPGSRKRFSATGNGVSPDSQDPDVYAQIWQSKGMLMRIASRHHQDLLATQNPEAKKLKVELDQTRFDLNRAINQPLPDEKKQAERMRELTQKKEDLEKAIAVALNFPPRAPDPRLVEFEKKMRELGIREFNMPKHQTQTKSVHARGEVENWHLGALLPAKSVFVDFFRYDRVDYDQEKRETRTPQYAAFVLGPHRGARRVELGPADVIETDLKSWRSDIERGRPSDAARRLGERLWIPLLKHEWTVVGRGGIAVGGPGRRVQVRQNEAEERHVVSVDVPEDTEVVYLSPDAELTRLPWPALPGRNPGKVLLEEHALAVVPHGPFLFQQLQQKPRSDEKGGLFLAYGAVRYDEPPGAVKQKAVDLLALNRDRGSDGHAVWPPLAGTARELDQIRDLASYRKLETLERRGSQASVAELINDLPKARWAHFATHGFFADADSRSILQLTPADYARSQRGERIQAVGRSPLLLSGIVLAGANRKSTKSDARFDPDGGIMTGEALIGLRLEDLDLAVLSACETGLGEVAGGEGVFGLQRSFHVAGARNVVSSLWRVDDDATAALMTLFYQKLWGEEKPPLEALREAQLYIYGHPDQIASLASTRGLSRKAMAPTPREDPRHAATKQWAAFTLSGLGRPPLTPQESAGLPGSQRGR